MFRPIVGLAVFFGLCAICAPCLAADNLPFSPTAAPSQDFALCPPGQVAARPSGQLWVNQSELHTAWDCFVPRPHAFAGQSGTALAGHGPDPAQRSALPAFAGTRTASPPANRPAASQAPSQATSQPGQVQVKVDVEVDVDVQVSANGEPVAASSGQVSLPSVNLNLSGTGQTSVVPNPNAAAEPGAVATPVAPVQGAQPNTSGASPTANPVTVPETSIVPVLPVQPPRPDLLGPNPLEPDASSPDQISPTAIAPQANLSEPGPEVDALLNARPVLPNQGAGSERSLVSPKV